MRIQIIAHNTEIKPGVIKMRWNWLPMCFEEAGHEVDHVLKQDWKYFYLRYLKFKPDVLISVGPIAFIPSLLKKLKLIKVLHVHDWTDDNVDINGKEHGITKMALFEYFTIENADYITTPSIYRKERCELWGKNVYYIQHGVDKDFECINPAKLNGKVKIIYAGEQSERKRVDKLIEAVKDMDCDLYLFGRTNKNFENFASKEVHFMGLVDQKDIPGYLKAADILVLTMDNDSCLKMFEYIKAGKTILGIRGKLNYFLSHTENAYLTDDLAKGLMVLINNPELRNLLEENVKKIKVDTWEEIAEKYIGYLNRMVTEYHEEKLKI